MFEHGNMWKNLHKAIDRTLLIPTTEAFRALGKEACNVLDSEAGTDIMRRLLQNHIFGQKIALLVQTDTIEVDNHCTQSATFSCSSYFDAKTHLTLKPASCFVSCGIRWQTDIEDHGWYYDRKLDS